MGKIVRQLVYSTSEYACIVVPPIGNISTILVSILKINFFSIKVYIQYNFVLVSGMQHSGTLCIFISVWNRLAQPFRSQFPNIYKMLNAYILSPRGYDASDFPVAVLSQRRSM